MTSPRRYYRRRGDTGTRGGGEPASRALFESSPRLRVSLSPRLLFFVLLLAACDTAAPDEAPTAAAPPPATIEDPAKTNGPGEGPLVWAFPPEIEKSRVVYADFDLQALRWVIHKTNVDGTGAQVFDFPRDNPGDGPDVVFQAFRWSKDGRRLVYRSSDTNTDNFYLVLIDSSGTTRRLLTPHGGFADDPDWRPQGDRVLYGRGGFFGGQFGTLIQTSIVDTLGQVTDFFVDPESRFFEGDSVFYALFDDGTNALYDAAWAPAEARAPQGTGRELVLSMPNASDKVWSDVRR